MPADDNEVDRGGAAPQSWGATVFAWLEAIEKWLRLLRNVALSVAVVTGVLLVIVLVGRGVLQEGIVIDPVIVQLVDPKDGPTPELAAVKIAAQIDAIQRAGVGEWRRLYVDQAPNPIDLQIPGSPFTLRGGMREIAAFFGFRPPTVRVAIVGRRASPALVASVSVDGVPGAQGACQEKNADAAGMDRLLDCVALNTMSVIDPKVAASHMFHEEVRHCVGIDAGLPSEVRNDPVLREQKRIAYRRGLCFFPRTQALIAETLKRGRSEDLPWVPYVYGKVHLARAAALAGVDQLEQLGEYDQAIGRLLDAQNRTQGSLSAIANLFEAYVQKGISIHEATRGLDWSNDPASPVQWQLYLAEATFADAMSQLRRIPARRDAALDALVQRLEGTLYYRQWMVRAHRRTRSGLMAVATGQPEELALLRQAAARYEAAERNARPMSLYMDWGNVLRAAGDFDAAAIKYRQAADLSPTAWEPLINLAVAHLDRVIHGKTPADPGQVLVALGSASGYLSWVSGGDPTPNLRAKVEAALAMTGVPEDLTTFQECYSAAATAAGDDRDRSLAGRKHCVDLAIQQVSERQPRAARAPVPPAKAR
jgi:tetratricopeptide (TPR) repeat protein